MSLRNAIAELMLPVASFGLRNGFYATYKKLEQTQWLPRRELESLQLSQLRDLLRHAVQRVPMYREVIHSNPDSFRTLEDLQRLPVITKADLREASPDRCIANLSYRSARLPNWTSGSTGEPFYFVMDRSLTGAKLANYYRNYRWASIAPGDRILKLWGTHDSNILKTLFVRFILGRREFGAYNMDQEQDTLLKLIRRHKPRAMESYTSAALNLAHIVQERDLYDIQFETIVTSAEPCDQHQKALLADTFGADVYDRYGSREFGIVAYDCKYHTGLHINCETNIVEIVDDAGHQLPEGKEGRVVITSLTNYVMPFIRYEIGDRGMLAPDDCPCGRQLPRLREITGRISDAIVLPSGRRQPFLFFNSFFRTNCEPYLEQYQVVQCGDGSLLVRLALKPGYAPSLPDRVARNLHEVLGREVDVVVKLVSHVPLTKSGKLLPVIMEPDIDTCENG